MSLRKKVVSLLFSNGLQAICQLVILIICSRTLTVHDYGSYRQFFLLYEVAVPLFGLGLAQSIFYFFSKSSQKLLILNKVVVVLTCSVAIFGLLILANRPYVVRTLLNNDALYSLLPLIIPFTLANLIIPILSSVFIENNRSRKLAAFNTIYVLTVCLFMTGGVVFYKNFHIAVHIRVGSAIVFAIIMYMVCRKDLANYRTEPAEASIKEVLSYGSILRYSIPLGVAGAAGVLSQQVDKIIISYFASPHSFAVYSNGAIEIPLIGVITGALATASISDLSRKIQENDLANALRGFKRVAEISSLFLFPAFVYFFVCAEEFMVLLFGDNYRQSAVPFRIYLLLIPARVVFYGPVLIAFGKSKALLNRATVELFLNAGLSVVLASFLGYTGVAIATIIVTYTWSIGYNLKVLRHCFGTSTCNLLPFRTLTMHILCATGASPVIFLCMTQLINYGVLVSLICSATLYATCFLLIYYSAQFIKPGKLMYIFGQR